MRNQSSGTFNKEKFIFLGVTALLAICVYKSFSSRPVRLEVSTPVTPLPVPAPLAPEVPDTRQGDVTYYLQSGVYSGLAVNRERNDPFAPIYIQSEIVPAIPSIADNKNRLKPIVDVPIAPGPPDIPKPEEKRDPNKFGGTDIVAKVDFSAVISMNGTVYGLLKDKDGKTIQVKVGDYLDDFKYTVTKIDKQAIWVTDENDHMFVARDQSFAVDASAGAGAGDDDAAPKKKDKAPKAAKTDAKTEAKPATTDSTAAALAEAAKQLANLQKSMAKNNNNNNVINNDNGGRKRQRGNY